MDRYAEARDAFRRVIAAQDKKAGGKPVSNGRVYGMKGLCEFQVKNYEVALADLLKARDLGVESDELLSAVRYHTAIIMTRLEQYEFAMLNLQPFAQKGNDAPTVIEAFGLATLRMPCCRPSCLPIGARWCCWPDAVRTTRPRGCRARRARFRGTGRALSRLAQRALRLRRVPARRGSGSRVEEFKKELKQSPAHSWSMLQIAFEYIKRSDWEAARPWAQQAVDTAPQDFAGRRALGQVLFELGETAGRHRAARARREAGARQPFAAFVLARAYQKAGSQRRRGPRARRVSQAAAGEPVPAVRRPGRRRHRRHAGYGETQELSLQVHVSGTRTATGTRVLRDGLGVCRHRSRQGTSGRGHDALAERGSARLSTINVPARFAQPPCGQQPGPGSPRRAGAPGGARAESAVLLRRSPPVPEHGRAVAARHGRGADVLHLVLSRRGRRRRRDGRRSEQRTHAGVDGPGDAPGRHGRSRPARRDATAVEPPGGHLRAAPPAAARARTNSCGPRSSQSPQSITTPKPNSQAWRSGIGDREFGIWG